MKVDVTVGHDLAPTTRMRQMSAMFDAPIGEKIARTWTGDVPVEEREWRIGAIIGPSGCGKSTLARHMFGEPTAVEWPADASVVDAFGDMPIDRITAALSSVGFNTIPAWMRPYRTLSNGERFRCDLARVLVDDRPLTWIDEFTSVVDRQVACIGSHAVAKFVRRQEAARRIVVASCHHDIVDWLQPDWTLEPATMTFAWRSVQSRPKLDGVIKRCPWGLWPMFAPYHYMTAELHRGARCFATYVDGRPVAFVGVHHMPISSGERRGENIMRVSRAVTLPDWQGLGIIHQLMETVGAAYAGAGLRFRIYPAHPSFIRSVRARTEVWRELETSTAMSNKAHRSSTSGIGAGVGGRACGRFEFVGAPMDARTARNLIANG